MATRKVIIDGDSTGLRNAASAATAVLKAELEAQKKAMADAKAAMKALSKDATAEEKNAAREAVAAAKIGLDAKRKAYTDGAAAAKAAAQAVKAAQQEEIKAQRDIVTALRETAKAKRDNWKEAETQSGERARTAAQFAASGKKGAGAPSSSADSDALSMISIIEMGGAMARLARSMVAFADDLDKRRKAVTDASLSAQERNDAMAEDLRLSGMGKNDAQSLISGLGGADGDLSQSQIAGAIAAAAKEGGGRLSKVSAEEIIKDAQSGSVDGAMTASTYGHSAKDSIAFAERLQQQAPGTTVTRSMAKQIKGLVNNKQIGSYQAAADYIAAGLKSGIDTSAMTPDSPFDITKGGLRLSNEYAQNRTRAETRQAAPSKMAIMKNKAELQTAASLSSGENAERSERDLRERLDQEGRETGATAAGAGNLQAWNYIKGAVLPASWARSSMLQKGEGLSVLTPEKPPVVHVEGFRAQPADK